MPQAAAAMSTKVLMPKILDRFGYRSVLVANTLILGVLLMLFALIGPGTPIWLIVVQAFCYGALTSTQYTSMNTLVYADTPEARCEQRQFDRQHVSAALAQFRASPPLD